MGIRYMYCSTHRENVLNEFSRHLDGRCRGQFAQHVRLEQLLISKQQLGQGHDLQIVISQCNRKDIEQTIIPARISLLKVTNKLI